MMSGVADEIVALFSVKGEAAYYGENVSQLEHALQAAYFAERDGANPGLVVAALVHDIGHLVDDSPEDIADHGIDTRHEELGERWLSERFGKDVCEPVRLHVAAKRYLCATDASYFGRLSAASVQSLALQGGAMCPEEVVAFEANDFYQDAVAVRRWDDEAKVVGLSTPGLETYRTLLDAVARS